MPEEFDDLFSPLASAEEDDPNFDEEADLLDADELGLAEESVAELEVDVGVATVPRTGRSWAFDFVTGRFVTRRGQGPLETSDDATLRGWIEKCLRTEREAHAIHRDTGFGLPPGDLIGGGAEAVADYEVRVRDALTVHPRITDVREFEARTDPEDPEVVWAWFTVVTDEGGDEMALQGVQLVASETQAIGDEAA